MARPNGPWETRGEEKEERRKNKTDAQDHTGPRTPPDSTTRTAQTSKCYCLLPSTWVDLGATGGSAVHRTGWLLLSSHLLSARAAHMGGANKMWRREDMLPSSARHGRHEQRRDHPPPAHSTCNALVLARADDAHEPASCERASDLPVWQSLLLSDEDVVCVCVCVCGWDQ